MSRKKEILIAVLIILALVVFFAFNMLNSDDDEKVLKELKSALDKRDMNLLKKHLVFEDGSKISEEEIKDIIKAAEEKGIVLSDTNVLNEEEVVKDEDDKEDIINPMYFKRDGKKKLFFDDYKMVFGLYDLILEIQDENISEIKVFIDEVEVKDLVKIDNKFICFGIKPGIKNVTVKFGEGFKQEVKLETVLLEQNSKVLNLDLYNLDRSKNLSIYDFNSPILENVDVESIYINVYTNAKELDGEVFLYVNGEKTDIKLSSEYTKYGPIFKGQECKVQAKMKLNGKEYVSSEIDAVENKYGTIYLQIDYHDEEKDKVKEVSNTNYMEYDSKIDEQNEEYIQWTLMNYLENLVYAINEGDYSLVEDCIYDGSKLHKQQEKLVSNLYDKGTKEELLGYKINSMKKLKDDDYAVDVTERHKLFYNDGKVKNVENRWIYKVKIENDYGYVYSLENP